MKGFRKKVLAASHEEKYRLLLVAMLAHDMYFLELPRYLNPTLLHGKPTLFVKCLINKIQQIGSKPVFVDLIPKRLRKNHPLRKKFKSEP